MLELDIAQFWQDDALAHGDNCFTAAAPQVALGIRMSEECVFAELGEEGNPWGETPWQRRRDLNRRYNDRAEQIVGLRLLPDDPPPPAQAFPAYRQIGEVFGGRYVYDGNTTWLQSDCRTPGDLERVLLRAERILAGDFRAFVLPPDWEREARRLYESYGLRPSLYQGVRGPVTLATSIYGAENLIFLLYDAPELADRFRDLICRAILAYIRLFIQEAGYGPNRFPHGFGFADDDCNLLSPELYARFGLPVLREVFAFAAPDPGDNRFQHSDSAMGHLLPLLATLNLTGCNFGPTVTVTEIRRYMPHTRIDGQLAPFTFMRNDEAQIIAEVRRDCDMARESGVKGLNLSTAGSINNGSLLTSMRTVMAAIQNYGRY